MRSINDLTGKRFGKLTVLERAINDKRGNTRWRCLCDCGNETIVRGSSMTCGDTTSCGCNWREATTKHGHHGERTYRIWKKMRGRCNDTNDADFRDYGGRGIKVCDEWSEFKPFYEWAMEHGYSDDLSIDRVDNDRGYSPDNCKWSTNFEQARNRRSNHLLTYDGKTMSMVEWSELTGIPYQTLASRILSLGWSSEQALTTPVRKMRYKRKEV